VSRFLRPFVAPAVGIVLFGLVWELVVRVFDIRRFVLLAPSAILSELADQPARYWENTIITAQRMAGGLIISLVVALAVGSIMAASRFVNDATQPVLVLILVTPWVAYMTSVVIWLGFGVRPVLFLVAFTAFPVFAFGVVGGMRSADPATREVLASVDASRWEVWWRLRMPSALPSIFTTARFAIGLALAATYFAEGKAGNTRGLGVIGQRAALDQTNGAETLWTTIVCCTALGIVGLTLVSVAERVFLSWHVAHRN
jgi:NitT/TauT family transport system permease protein